MRFKKGDLLATKHWPAPKPLCRVTKVTREGVVHCVNLVACSTMNEGDKFHFTPDKNTRYELHSGG
jgi:hypothetical protein